MDWHGLLAGIVTGLAGGFTSGLLGVSPGGGLVVFSVAGFLALEKRYRSALIILITAVSAEAADFAVKQVYLRPRPTVVPHLRDVVTTSFPRSSTLPASARTITS